MTQINFSLSSEEFIGLFCSGREEAMGKLMENLLNQFLVAESSSKLGADPYERNEERKDYRNGSRERKVNTRIGRLNLQVPRHRHEPFHTALIENFQRNEQALLATFMEMVIQGVSTRKVEKITQELCGTTFSKSQVSEICKGLDPEVQSFKNRPLDEEYPFIMADAMYIKVQEDFRVRSKGLMVVMGINLDGRREILGFDLCETETQYHWESLFTSLKRRGLRHVDLVTSDNHSGLVAAVQKVFQNASWQRCQFHFTRNILDKAPKRYQKGLSTELKDMFNCSSLEAAKKKKDTIFEDYTKVAPDAMETLDEGFLDAMTVMSLPVKYRKPLRTTNYLERENQELRRREKVIRIFPNAASVLRLLGALLLDHHENWALLSRVFNMKEYLESRSKFCEDMCLMNTA